MADPHENLEIIFCDWLDAVRRGDLELPAARLAPEVFWQGVEPQLVCETRQDVIEALRSQREAGIPRVHRLELAAAGDKVMLGLAGPDLDGIGDVALDGEAYVVFTLRDGQIVRMHDYRRREEAIRAAGLAD